MTLKTLKDIKEWEFPLMNEERTEVDGIDYHVSKSELRKEAIKWVKASREEEKAVRDDMSETKWDEGYWDGFHENFKDFFNITEEDLK